MSRAAKSRLQLSAVLSVALAILGVSSEASAFCRSTTCSGECPRDGDGCKTEGQQLFWKSLCVGFSLQENGSEHIDFAIFEEITDQSFVSWTEAECPDGLSSLLFTRLDDVACQQAEYNPSGANANVIMFQDHKWQYVGVDNTLAKTTVTYDSETGEILDADIELNHAFNELTVGDGYVVYDLQSILTHEVGHFIGFDHTPDFNATMYAGYDKGSTAQRDLALDDVEGLCAVYPPDRDATCEPKPQRGFTKQCLQVESEEEEGCTVGAPGAGGWRGAPWLLLLWPWWRRRAGP